MCVPTCTIPPARSYWEYSGLREHWTSFHLDANSGTVDLIPSHKAFFPPFIPAGFGTIHCCISSCSAARICLAKQHPGNSCNSREPLQTTETGNSCTPHFDQGTTKRDGHLLSRRKRGRLPSYPRISRQLRGELACLFRRCASIFLAFSGPPSSTLIPSKTPKPASWKVP